MSTLKSYYIGEPSKGKRGQDKHGTVRCQLWLTIDKDGRSFDVRRTGGVVGQFRNLKSAQRYAQVFAIMELKRNIDALLSTVLKQLAALGTLCTAPNAIELFDGPYSDKIPQQMDLKFEPSASLRKALKRA